MQTDDQANWLVKFITQNATVPTNTRIDAIGVGGGVVDVMCGCGLGVQEFIAGGKPSLDKYDNLRSEVIYEFAQDLERGRSKSRRFARSATSSSARPSPTTTR
jgi:hypothetical protein